MNRGTNKKASSLGLSLKEIAQGLNGKLASYEVNAVMLTFTLIRRMELILEPHRDAMRQIYVKNVNVVDSERMHEMLCKETESDYYNTSGSSLAQIITSGSDYFNRLHSYVFNFCPAIIELLLMMEFEELIVKLNYKQALFSVMNSFAGLDLSKEKVRNSKLIEGLEPFALDEENMSPALFSSFASALLFGQEVAQVPMDFYDPACGTGALLRAVIKDYRKKAPNGLKSLNFYRQTHAYGQDVNQEACAVTRIMTILTGDDPEHIALGDTIEYDVFSEKTFKYIVCDPPLWTLSQNERGSFGISRNYSPIIRHSQLGQGVRDLSLVFMNHVISKMAPEGARAAVFTSLAALRVGGNASMPEDIFRKEILRMDLVEAIIALPFGISVSQKAPRFLWILNNKKSKKQQGKVRLIDCNKVRTIYPEKTQTDQDLVDFIAEKCYTKDLDKCSVSVDNLAFGKYQITLVNQRSKESRVVDVPMQEDVYQYLEMKGYRMGNNHAVSEVRDDDYCDGESVWEIDFPKTSSSCVIDFSTYFSEIKEVVPSVDSFLKIQPALKEISELADSLNQFKRVKHRLDLTPCEIEWYKEAPSHWSLTSGSHCLTARTGHSFRDYSTVDGIPFLTIPYLRGNELPLKYVSAWYVNDSERIVQEGETVVIISGDKAGEYLSGRFGIISSSLAVVRSKDESVLDPSYLGYLMIAAEGYFKSTTYGAVIKRLTIGTICDMSIYLPPINEQIQIAAYLDSICSKIARLQTLGFNNPELQEFRKSLIYEAVTGKLDLDDMK